MSGLTSRFDSRAFRRAALLPFALMLLTAIAASVFESSYWNVRLSAQSAARGSARLQTTGEEYRAANGTNSPALSNSEVKERLLTNASEYLASRPGDPGAQKTVDSGLARWNVDGSNASTAYSTQRGNDARASRSAISALESLDSSDSDPDLDAALSFLRELDSEPQAESENELRTLALDDRNPLDSVGVFAPSDLEPGACVQAARAACGASSRLFFLLTLGVLLCNTRGRLGCENSLENLFGISVFLRAFRRLIAASTRRAEGASLALYGDCVVLRVFFKPLPLTELETIRLLN